MRSKLLAPLLLMALLAVDVSCKARASLRASLFQFKEDVFTQNHVDTVQTLIRNNGSTDQIKKSNKYPNGKEIPSKKDHHIISQSKIKAYLNARFVPLFDGGDSKQKPSRKQVTDSMNAYIRKVGGKYKDIMKNPSNELSEFIDIVIWNPGNTVPGPGERSDDPENNIDEPILKKLEKEGKFKNQCKNIRTAIKNIASEVAIKDFFQIWTDVAGGPEMILAQDDWVETSKTDKRWKVKP